MRIILIVTFLFFLLLPIQYSYAGDFFFGLEGINSHSNKKFNRSANLNTGFELSIIPKLVKIGADISWNYDNKDSYSEDKFILDHTGLNFYSSIFLKGYLPITKNTNMFGSLGAGIGAIEYYEPKSKTILTDSFLAVTSETEKQTKRESGTLFGIGILYNVTEVKKFFFKYNYFKLNNYEFSIIGLGIQYGF